MDPLDEPGNHYSHALYEEHTSAGMAQDALVEIKQYAVVTQTISGTSELVRVFVHACVSASYVVCCALQAMVCCHAVA